MRILFIHRHYPGPFKQLAENFGAVGDNTTLFVSERGSRELRLPGVRRLRVGPPTSYENKDEAERELVAAQRRAVKVANTLLRLRKDGFSPDLVVCSSNDGYNLYVRDIFPDAFLVARAEWFFTRGESHVFFTRGKPRPAADFAPARVRNLFQYNSIGDCDLALASTQWQRSQYPRFLQEMIEVVHDGVDALWFHPSPGARFSMPGCDLSQAEELVTFSSRRAGPSRGFGQFCRALPRLLEARPKCHVLVMASSPEEGGRKSLGQEHTVRIIYNNLEEPLHSRVHVVDFSDGLDYRLLLQASTAHVYLTAPYTLSAGLFEAMSSGVLLVGSDTPPVREVVEHGRNGFLADFWNPEHLAHTLTGVLEHAGQFGSIRQAARQTVTERYDLRKQSEIMQSIILERMAARKI